MTVEAIDRWTELSATALSWGIRLVECLVIDKTRPSLLKHDQANVRISSAGPGFQKTDPTRPRIRNDKGRYYQRI